MDLANANDIKLPVDAEGAEKIYDEAIGDVRKYIDNFLEKIEHPKKPKFIREKAMKELEKILVSDTVEQLLREIIFKGKAIVGVLLEGPPGVGKTETVMSIAAMHKIPVLRLNKGDIMSKYQGESGNKMQAAFYAAEIYGRRNGKPVFLIIDELDTMVPSRGMDEMQGSGQREVTNVLLNLLGTSESPIKYAIPIGMTNKRDMIDEAVARRFGKTVLIPPADTKEVQELVNNAVTKWNERAPEMGLPTISIDKSCQREIDRLLPGLSFQILNNVVSKMIENAVRRASEKGENSAIITRDDLEDALVEYERDIKNFLTKGCQGYNLPLDMKKRQNFLLARINILALRRKKT